MNFREEFRPALGGSENLLHGWLNTANVVRATAKKMLPLSSGQRKGNKETCWRKEDVQENMFSH